MMDDYGIKWARAILLDPELREDFELWLQQLGLEYAYDLQREENEVKLRWAQGARQTVERIVNHILNVEHSLNATSETSGPPS